MLRVVFLFSILLRLSVTTLAQDNPKFEVFGGYSLEHIQPCGHNLGCGNSVTPRPTLNYNGWNASLTGYFYRFLGATADFTGHYGQGLNAGVFDNPVSRYSYMFGPVAAVRGEKASIFAHGLFGLVSQRDKEDFGKYDRFAWAVGGGFDVNATRRISVRPAEIDYERVNVPGFVSGQTFPTSGFRYSAGIVFKF